MSVYGFCIHILGYPVPIRAISPSSPQIYTFHIDILCTHSIIHIIHTIILYTNIICYIALDIYLCEIHVYLFFFLSLSLFFFPSFLLLFSFYFMI